MKRDTRLASVVQSACDRRTRPVATRQAVEHLECRLLLSTVPPSVLQIVRTSPAGPVTAESAVTFTVTFNQPVSGVDASDFRAVPKGAVAFAPSPVVAPAGGNAYTVTVTGVHGAGDLELDLIDDDSIVNSANIPLGGAGAANGSFAGPAYTILQPFPTVLSIARTGPPGPDAPAGAVTFTVTFSSPVTGVTAASFQPVAGAGVSVSAPPVVSTVSASVYSVTVGGISGAGTLGLNLVDTGAIRDAAGNPLVALGAAPSFAPQQTFATDTDTRAVALADFNGDGKADWAVANRTAATVGIRLGTGGGAFGPQTTLAVASPASLAAADVNGDGRPDLVVPHANDAAASIFIGLGDGTFSAGYTVAAGGMNLASVTVADFDGDGKPDLLFAKGTDNGENSVSLAAGNGDGTFAAPMLLPTGRSPLAAAAADVNGDGIADALSVNTAGAGVSVLLGNGDRSFKPFATFAVGTLPFSLAAADVNGDGKVDLVTANLADDSVSVLLGNNDGTFQPQRTFAAGYGAATVLVADVNGDGKPDLLVADRQGSCVGVLAGNGDGTFAAQLTFATALQPAPPPGSTPFALALGDLDGDGRPDLAVANSGTANVGVFHGSGAGGYVGPIYNIVPPANHLVGTAAADQFTLARNADHQHIDWTMGTASGQFLAADSAGATITGAGGNDLVTLDYAHGNPLPVALHLEGTFTIVGLQGTNPLAGTTLDVGRGVVRIRYTDAVNDPIAAIRSYLATGYNGGDWKGTASAATGAITSLDAQADPKRLTAIGYVDAAQNAQLNPLPNSVLLECAIAGDADLDGTVGLSDYTTVVRNFGTGADWTQGDVTYGPVVSLADYTTVVRNFGKSLPAAAPQFTAAALAFTTPSSAQPTSTLVASPDADSLARQFARQRVGIASRPRRH